MEVKPRDQLPSRLAGCQHCTKRISVLAAAYGHWYPLAIDANHRQHNQDMATSQHYSGTNTSEPEQAERSTLAEDLLCLSERAAGCITRPMTAVEGDTWLYDEVGLPH